MTKRRGALCLLFCWIVIYLTFTSESEDPWEVTRDLHRPKESNKVPYPKSLPPSETSSTEAPRSTSQSHRRIEPLIFPSHVASRVFCKPRQHGEPLITVIQRCHFQNVLVTRDNKIVFYAGPDDEVNRPGSPLWRLVRGSERLNIAAGWPGEEAAVYTQVILKAKGDRYPEPDAATHLVPAVDAEAAEDTAVVFYHPNWPENVGHYLFDDVFASFALLATFGHREPNMILLPSKDCDSFYNRAGFSVQLFKEHKRQLQRCEKLYAHWSPVLTGHDPIFSKHLPDHSVWVRNLYVGVGATSVRDVGSAGLAWPSFRRKVLDRLGFSKEASAVAKRVPRPHVTILVKALGLHKRRILNSDSITEAIRKTFECEVEQVDPSKLDLKVSSYA